MQYNHQLFVAVTTNTLKSIRALGLVAMLVTERTDDPSIASVSADDLTHGPVGSIPDCYLTGLQISHLGGKDLRALLRLEADTPGPIGKEELHVVCADGDSYQWSRHSDSEPWQFERRVVDGDEVDTASRQLPAVVEAIVEEREMIY